MERSRSTIETDQLVSYLAVQDCGSSEWHRRMHQTVLQHGQRTLRLPEYRKSVQFGLITYLLIDNTYGYGDDLREQLIFVTESEIIRIGHDL